MATSDVRSEPPLIVIVGPTASGKTALAIELAERFKGEIICGDSRTVYKGMDIGTAKPTREDRQRVPHWGLDLIEPTERFTAADFQRYATEKINEIRSRGHVPFLVGGTGLYIDGVIFSYEFGKQGDKKERDLLETMSLDELYDYCIKNNVELPENYKNKRYVIRAIEQKNINVKRKMKPLENSYIVGISTELTYLRKRIERRSEQLFEDGVVKEATRLGKKYGWDSEAMTGNIYRLCHKYIVGDISLNILKERNLISDWQLAKRQLTWFKRNKFIMWLPLDDANKYIASLLASRQ